MIKVIELFGGIGAVHSALDRVIGNGKFEIIEMVENNKTAVKAYNAIHNTQFIPQDILTWDKDIQCDYLHASTPCQAFSTNGLNQGAEDKRGLPLWEATIRIINKTKPMIVTLENVKGLLAKKHSNLLNYYLSELKKLGYLTKYIVLNSKDYGVPQNRERVFFISIKENISNVENIYFNFFSNALVPKFKDKRLKDILQYTTEWIVEEIKIDKTTTTNTDFVYIKNQMSAYKNNVIEIDLKKLMNTNCDRKINVVATIKDIKWENFINEFIISYVNLNDKMTKLNNFIYNNKNPIQLSKAQLSLQDVSFKEDSKFKSENGISGTITATNAGYKNKILTISSIENDILTICYRNLSALECTRLMGFKDIEYNQMIICGLSNSQIYKLVGNSIVVNVIEYILNVIFKDIKDNWIGG